MERYLKAFYYENKAVSFDTNYFETSGAGYDYQTYFSKSSWDYDYGKVSFSRLFIHSDFTNKTGGYLIAKATILTDTTRVIAYFNADGTPLWKVTANINNHTLIPTPEAFFCDVENCINADYSDFGFASQALFWGSFIDPGIGLTVVAACVATVAIIDWF